MTHFQPLSLFDKCLHGSWILLLSGFLAISGVTGAEPPAADQAVDTLFPQETVPTGSSPVSSPSATEIDKLETRVNQIETRLGKSTRQASVAYNFERRLADLERRIQQIEQSQSRLQQDVDQRLRRLEMK